MSKYYVTKDGEKVSPYFDDYVEAQNYRSMLEARSPDSGAIEWDVDWDEE